MRKYEESICRFISMQYIIHIHILVAVSTSCEATGSDRMSCLKWESSSIIIIFKNSTTMEAEGNARIDAAKAQQCNHSFLLSMHHFHEYLIFINDDNTLILFSLPIPPSQLLLSSKMLRFWFSAWRWPKIIRAKNACMTFSKQNMMSFWCYHHHMDWWHKSHSSTSHCAFELPSHETNTEKNNNNSCANATCDWIHIINKCIKLNIHSQIDHMVSGLL